MADYTCDASALDEGGMETLSSSMRPALSNRRQGATHAMRLRTNSLPALDIATLVHPQTNLRSHEQSGPRLITGGEGIYVRDESGARLIEAAAGLWCASLGFGVERL